jgi:ribosome maturation factor RimP
MLNQDNSQLKERIEGFISEGGLELIDFKISYIAGKYNLRCLVDYPQGGITIDKCAELNSKIFNFIQDGNILGDDFVVEVNSPGLDRLLKNYKDFLRVKGQTIGLWLNEPEDKNYTEGELLDLNEQSLTLKTKDGIRRLDFSKVKTGKIMIKF